MQLRDALAQITEIRQQMARTQLFRGYRAATTAFSGVVALGAAAIQHYVIGEATFDQQLTALWLWLGAAAVSVVVVGAEMMQRYRRRERSQLQREMTLMAVEQFVPCLVAGALLTYAIVEWAGNSINLLPGLWCTLFGLGVFASRRLLPRGTFLIGGWYLLAGLAAVATRKDFCFASQMAGAFGGGQLLSAGVLYWQLERVPAGTIDVGENG
jgi:hypothetical protein